MKSPPSVNDLSRAVRSNVRTPPTTQKWIQDGYGQAAFPGCARRPLVHLKQPKAQRAEGAHGLELGDERTRARRQRSALVLAVALVLGVALAGCGSTCPPDLPTAPASAGPPAAEIERAFAVAWEGVGGMEAAARPRVSWFDDSGCASPAFDGITASVPGACAQMWIDSYGNTSVGWHPGEAISDTGFATALAQWKLWLTTSAFTPSQTWYAYQEQFKAALRADGL